MNSLDFSVIICTCNRGVELERTLKALTHCNFERFAIEILIVDNGSTLSNQRLHQAISDRCPLIKYHKLPTMGLSKARNYGMAQSKGTIIAYFDDDALVHFNWFEEAHRFFEQYPKAGAIGGKIFLDGEPAVLEQLKPIEKLMLSGFDLGNEVKEMTYNNFPRGTHIAFRKSALEQVEGFSTKLGRMGPQLLSYEAIELCYRLEQLGHRIYYVPQLEVTHLIKTARLNSQWFANRAFWQGRSEAIFDAIHIDISYRWKKCFSIATYQKPLR